MATGQRFPFKQIAKKLSPRAELLSFRRLDGGVSARITALEMALAEGSRQTVVVRQHGDADRQRDPDIARHEFQLLEMLHASGLPVPRPLLADDSGEIFPEPYLIVEFIDGEPVDQPADARAFVTEMATVLANIHAVDFGEATNFLARPDIAVAKRLLAPPPVLDEPLCEGRIRTALSNAWPPAQRNESVLLHGDYWPGNTIWRDDRLVGIIDWEDAGTGDPLADLSNARLELMMHFGPEEMTTFTAHYLTLAPRIDLASLPLWDLVAALHLAGKLESFGLDAPTQEKFLAGHKRFVDEAIAKLAR